MFIYERFVELSSFHHHHTTYGSKKFVPLYIPFKCLILNIFFCWIDDAHLYDNYLLETQRKFIDITAISDKFMVFKWGKKNSLPLHSDGWNLFFPIAQTYIHTSIFEAIFRFVSTVWSCTKKRTKWNLWFSLCEFTMCYAELNKFQIQVTFRAVHMVQTHKKLLKKSSANNGFYVYNMRISNSRNISHAKKKVKLNLLVSSFGENETDSWLNA